MYQTDELNKDGRRAVTTASKVLAVGGVVAAGLGAIKTGRVITSLVKAAPKAAINVVKGAAKTTPTHFGSVKSAAVGIAAIPVGGAAYAIGAHHKDRPVHHTATTARY